MPEYFLIDERPLRIDAQGRYFQGDEPLHPRVEQLFRRHLHATPAGYELRIGLQRAAVTVADTGFFVQWTRLVPAGPTATATAPASAQLAVVRLGLSDGAEQDLDVRTLEQGPDHVLYTRIERDGLSVPCRFSPHQYHELALWMEMPEDAREPGMPAAVLTVGGIRARIAPYNHQVRPIPGLAPLGENS